MVCWSCRNGAHGLRFRRTVDPRPAHYSVSCVCHPASHRCCAILFSIVFPRSSVVPSWGRPDRGSTAPSIVFLGDGDETQRRAGANQPRGSGAGSRAEETRPYRMAGRILPACPGADEGLDTTRTMVAGMFEKRRSAHHPWKMKGFTGSGTEQIVRMRQRPRRYGRKRGAE